jgi:predicted Holliday junction resolvase-like endonuclease
MHHIIIDHHVFCYFLLIVTIILGVLTAGVLVAWKVQVDKRKKAEAKTRKVVSQKKSSEVRLGKIGENMAPFFTGWPYDPNKFRFLGNPVDGIQFEDDEVIFVEIKTGKARLTTSQKTVKQLVQEGKVRFATFRVGEDGCSLKIED